MEAFSIHRGLFRFFGCGTPHPSGPLALPPSPWGKATSGGGCIHRSLFLVYRGPLHTRQGLWPCHPLQAGEGPSSVPGFARSTFPVGEGDLRRGLG